jgi:hypothetical protein
MPLQLRFDDIPQDISNASDLSQFLKTSGTATFKFTKLSAVKSITLGNAPTGLFQLPFNSDQELAWDLGKQGNVTFSFLPTATAAVQIQNSGDLFHYNLGDDESDRVSVPVPPGMAYVTVLLNVCLTVSAGPGFSAGDFGVSAQVDSSTTFALVFRKAFPIGTLVLDAVHQTFEAFVLPFRANGAASLHDGDYIDYEFIGKIATGIGITYGVSASLLSGRSISEIQQAFGNSALGQTIVNHIPSYEAGASFAVEYEHVDTFRVVVGRHQSPAGNSISMCVFRRGDKKVSTTETLGISLVRPISGDIVSNLEASAGGLAASAFGSIVAGSLRTQATNGLTKALGSNAQGPMKDFLTDVGQVLRDLVTKHDIPVIQLQLMQQRVKEDTALFNFTFDLNQPDALSQGYELAIQGDFANAVKIAGVALNPGSYLEDAVLHRTSATLEFFDLFKIADVTEYFDKVSTVYAGNGVFRLVLKVGVDDTVTVHGKDNSCEVYFIAEPPASGAAASAADMVVSLNFALIDQTSQSAKSTIRALDQIGGAALQAAAAQVPAALTGKLKVTCKFSQDAFSRIACDEYVGGKPSPLPHPIDAANYAAFVAAVQKVIPADNLQQEFLALFASYDAWVEFNRVKIDQEGSTEAPDRRSVGNEAVSVWPIRLDKVLDRSGLQCYLYAAQSYMNLCEGLKHLASDLDAQTFAANFDLLQKSLDKIINQDINVFFIKPALAALFQSCGGVASGVQSKTGAQSREIAFQADVAQMSAAVQ